MPYDTVKETHGKIGGQFGRYRLAEENPERPLPRETTKNKKNRRNKNKHCFSNKK